MKRSRINYINLLPLIALKYASLYVAPVSCGSLHWILERTIWKFCSGFLQPLFLVFLLDGRVNHRTCVSVGSVRLTFLPLIYVEKKKPKVVKGLTVVVLIKKKLYIFSLFLSLSEVFGWNVSFFKRHLEEVPRLWPLKREVATERDTFFRLQEWKMALFSLC